MGRVVLLLQDYFWHAVFRPSGKQHIVYEQFDASVWGIGGPPQAVG